MATPDEPAAPTPDFEALAANMARLVEEMGKATAAAVKPVEEGGVKSDLGTDIGDMTKTLGRVAEGWIAEPEKFVRAQAELAKDFLDLWSSTLARFQGGEAGPVATPAPGDKRFRDPEWTENPFFDFVKQAYLLTADWAETMVKESDDLDPHLRHKANFYVKQIASALSPSNFLVTNPELIRVTLAENGENLVRGMKMLAEDIEAGKGKLKVRQSDLSKFEVGVNIAVTPGKVVYRNDIIELIQYAPTTETVLKRPLLITPPWINKFYILDLNRERSFIRWAVAEGLTVFVISWVNPDERQAKKGFDDYMREGIIGALDQVEAITGEEEITAIGYCVGGTLLAASLAYMAARGDRRVTSATFFTTQVDFTHAGDMLLFTDEDQISLLEDRMYAQGYLEGSSMANTFNMMRPNDLIWPYVVSVYMKGQQPMPFDLLYWNADSTRMPATNHSFYLRQCYLENRLAKGEVVLAGERIDLKKVTIPVYMLAAKEDHIAPAKSAFVGCRSFGGPVTYVLGGSGHIAGVVNPPIPGKPPKYQHWTDGPPTGAFEDWVAGATEHPGSWWPNWFSWIRSQAPDRVPAREPGGGKVTPLADAPGEYVKVRA